VTTFSLLVDGERLLRVDSEADVRAWVATYCEEHAADDPDAAHVQIIERGALAWLTGGRLVDRTRFF
jgi:hypothetical protein